MTSPSTDTSDARPDSQHKAFGRTYWMLNSIEAFERLAYFGIRSVAPVYIMQATEPGGLHLTATDKGWIYMWWAIFQSWLPMLTGGVADRYGYKRVLRYAITANIVGYIMMAYLTDYYGFFAGILVLATGTAFFKPALQGSIAQNLNKDNSSMGWGIFYWVVNIGAVTAPLLATVILGKPHSAEGWRNLFLASAGYTAVNLLLLFTFKDVPSGASKSEDLITTLERTLVNLWNIRLVSFLLIMSCFWMMMYQVWDLHPNFIEDWVNSASVANHVPFESWKEYGDQGLVRVPQQILLTLNAFLIVCLVVPMSWLVRRMRTLSAMLIGMTVATIGTLVAGLTGNGWILLLGVVFFSLGEMLTGPKKNQYLGLIAPPGKKGLYLGYVNIPVGVGVGLGSMIAGLVYNNYGEKATLALKELGARPQLIGQAAKSIDWSDSLENVTLLSGITKDQAFDQVMKETNLPEAEAARMLKSAFRYDDGQITNLALLYLSETSPNVEPDRHEAFELVRHHVNQGDNDKMNSDTVIEEMLWTRFGENSDTLGMLSLEYLAQQTDAVAEAVQNVHIEDPIENIPKLIGIGRTKAFAALSVALGASSSEVDLTLQSLGINESYPGESALPYLASLPHHRFRAIGKRDWTNDVPLLREMVESDPQAQAKAIELMGEDFDYALLADNQHIIHAVLDEKDWKTHPRHAAQLLRLNPYEARALVAAELNKSPQTTTQLLWQKYDPQYHVWIPFASIGLMAMLALAVFGQKAKKWADMNA